MKKLITILAALAPLFCQANTAIEGYEQVTGIHGDVVNMTTAQIEVVLDSGEVMTIEPGANLGLLDTDLIQVLDYGEYEVFEIIDSPVRKKRAVAIALRNRWRRQALTSEMKDEVLPKNILMIGPTGVGKTEISRRLSKLAEAPFIKVEATRFTEVGYVGRDVEQIIRDLLEIAIAMEKVKKRKVKRKVRRKSRR